MPEETVPLIPDPARTMEGLRDMGYSFETAVADLVDNSIAANATTVDISVQLDFRGQVRLAIADNGHGMDRKHLVEAMTYGSVRRSDPASLGKFGLGLKTASTAWCRRLSVISRPTGKVCADDGHMGSGLRRRSRRVAASDHGTNRTRKPSRISTVLRPNTPERLSYGPRWIAFCVATRIRPGLMPGGH